jgi:hypothetical protein
MEKSSKNNLIGQMKKRSPFEQFFAFDSSAITLFSEVMKGVGRNRKEDGRKKGGLKVHMLTDIHADTAKFVKISEAKVARQKLSQTPHFAQRQYDCFR